MYFVNMKVMPSGQYFAGPVCENDIAMRGGKVIK